MWGRRAWIACGASTTVLLATSGIIGEGDGKLIGILWGVEIATIVGYFPPSSVVQKWKMRWLGGFQIILLWLHTSLLDDVCFESIAKFSLSAMQMLPQFVYTAKACLEGIVFSVLDWLDLCKMMRKDSYAFAFRAVRTVIWCFYINLWWNKIIVLLTVDE